MILLRLVTVGLLCCAALATAASAPPLAGVNYDPAVPTMQSVLGYPFGGRISAPAELRRYFDALAAAAPDRIRVLEHGRSWQGRPLFHAVIGRPDRLQDLAGLQARISAVADPGALDADAARAAADDLPGTLWLAYGVHGNEISSPDAAAMLAYHLLAATGDATVDAILADTLVFIEPMQNPDGRARFVHQFRSASGLLPQADRQAAEHDEPWPSGRVNHYLFDLNRDWLPLTQPETRARVAALRQWLPLVFVDAHEMGPDSTYFFAPEAVPYNPHIQPAQKAALARVGRNNARWFDRLGHDYFTREVFDAFYPGYGASWPSYYGAVAMTYEQASARGLVMRRRDGSTFSYADTVRQHFVATLATAETVAQERGQLWLDFIGYRHAAATGAGRGEPAAWLLPAQADQRGVDRLADVLAQHGVATYRAEQPVRGCGGTLAAGAVLVPLAQPAAHFVRTALDPQVAMDAQFLARQDQRRALGLPDEIYDVTAWSLPLMANLTMQACTRVPSLAALQRVRPGALPGGRLLGAAEDAVAWLVAGGSQGTAEVLAAVLRAGLSVQSGPEPFTLAGRAWPSGTLVLRTADNPADLARTLAAVAARTGTDIEAVPHSWVTEGPSFGSFNVRRLIAPRIALAWDEPASPYSAGAVRYVVEQRLGYPVTPIRGSTLIDADLRRYDVLVLPDGRAWGKHFDTAAVQRLQAWVAAGGVLVTLAGGTAWAAEPAVGLLALRREQQLAAPPADEAPDAATVAGTELVDSAGYQAAIAPREARPDSVAGALVRATVDREHWLAAGVADRLHVLVRGRNLYAPLRLDQGRNVVRFDGPDELLASGHMWPENQAQLAYKPFVVVQPTGDGMVIGFTQDPTVRAYLDGLQPLLANALLRAPAWSGRLR